MGGHNDSYRHFMNWTALSIFPLASYKEYTDRQVISAVSIHPGAKSLPINQGTNSWGSTGLINTSRRLELLEPPFPAAGTYGEKMGKLLSMMSTTLMVYVRKEEFTCSADSAMRLRRQRYWQV